MIHRDDLSETAPKLFSCSQATLEPRVEVVEVPLGRPPLHFGVVWPCLEAVVSILPSRMTLQRVSACEVVPALIAIGECDRVSF